MKAKKYLMAFAAIAALNSCSQNEEFALDNGQSSYDKNAVTFGTYLGQSPTTRATVTDIDVMKGETYPGFGVFAYNTGTNGFADATDVTPNFMCNVPVKWDNTAWAYGEEKLWPENEKVSFFAYAPHIATSGAANNITAISGETATGAPVISFKVAETVDDQIDLLYADAQTDQTKDTNGGKVQFSFKHALSRVGFKAKLEGEAGNTKSITIDSITFKSSTLGVSADLNLLTGEWSNRQAGDMEYTFKAKDFINGSNEFTVSTDAGTAEPMQLTGNGKYLMLIPTEETQKASIEITVHYVEETTDGSRTIYNVPTTFDQTFEQGKAYNFVLSISLASPDDTVSNVKFDVTEVVKWDTPDSDPEGHEVPIINSGEMATVILHKDNGQENVITSFTGNCSRFVTKLGKKDDEIIFVIPEFQSFYPDMPDYFGGDIILIPGESSSANPIFLYGWSKERIDIRTYGLDSPPDLDDVFADIADRIFQEGAQITVKAGETIDLYPVFYQEAW